VDAGGDSLAGAVGTVLTVSDSAASDELAAALGSIAEDSAASVATDDESITLFASLADAGFSLDSAPTATKGASSLPQDACGLQVQSPFCSLVTNLSSSNVTVTFAPFDVVQTQVLVPAREVRDTSFAARPKMLHTISYSIPGSSRL
jgi:hypothetical protein